MDNNMGTLLLVWGSLLYAGVCAIAPPTVRITRPNSVQKTVRLGSNVNIQCEAIRDKDDPLRSLGWQYVADGSLNPANIKSDASHEITVSQGTTPTQHSTELILNEMTYPQEGYYYCHIVTYTGEATAYVEIRIEGPPVIDVSLSTPQGAIDTTLGETLEIVCKVRGSPDPGIVWRKDGREVSSLTYSISTTPSLLDKHVSSTMTVFPLSRSELGVYVCQAENSFGRAAAKWEVRAVPHLMITHPNNATTTIYGQQVRIECEGINFDTNRQILWFFEGYGQDRVRMNNSGRVHISSWGDAGSTHWSELIMDSAVFEDQGSYWCVSGDLSVAVLIRVYGEPIVTVNEPVITALPGESVTFTCDIEARPKPYSVKWFAGDYQLGTSAGTAAERARYSIQTTLGDGLFGSTELTVNSIRVDDYNTVLRCRVTNTWGTSNTNLTLKDVNECEDGVDTCDPDIGEECVDTLGSYDCACRPGYTKGDNQCLDLDECSSSAVLCTQLCDNTQGSYHCSCQQGFVLLSDRITCVSTNSGGTTQANTAAGGNHVAVGVGVGVGLLALLIIIVVIVVCYRRKDANKRELIDVPKAKQNSPVRGFYNTAYSVEGEETHIYSELDPTGDEFPRGRIRFLNSLGEGKFGRVVKAEALSITRSGKWEEVAVKMVKETATDAVKEDFYHELMIVRKIPKHTNVVTYLGCVTASDPVLIIMEYVPGGDLLTYLRKRRPEGDVTDEINENDILQKDMLSFGLQAARGLAHISAQKIVHRDVAARNVLIDGTNVCKISDFGLARDVEGSDVYERTNKGPLPIRWMAPESLADSIHTSKSDVWAYGVLLWEIVTLGASPYPGMSGQMVMGAVLEGKRLTCPPQCSSQMYSTMSRCWQLLPKSRPTFSELARDFEKMLEDEGDYIQFDHIEEGIYQVLEGTRSEEKL